MWNFAPWNVISVIGLVGVAVVEALNEGTKNLVFWSGTLTGGVLSYLPLAILVLIGIGNIIVARQSLPRPAGRATPVVEAAQAVAVAAEIFPVIRDFMVGVDGDHRHVIVAFVPETEISRLRVCVEYSFYRDGMVGERGWSVPPRVVGADLSDLAPGVRQIVELTAEMPPVAGQDLPHARIVWAGSDHAVVGARDRCRVILLVPGRPEIARWFFAVPYMREDIGRVWMIDEGDFPFREAAESDGSSVPRFG